MYADAMSQVSFAALAKKPAGGAGQDLGTMPDAAVLGNCR
jgi:hypothetical protein